VIKSKKLAVITIHKGDLDHLKKTLNSVDTQIINPDLHVVIINHIGFNHSKIFEKKYRKIIISKDKSIFEAFNIGIKNTLDYNVIFLNSGDTFYDNKSIQLIKYNLCGIKCLIFKTIIVRKNKFYYPTQNFFKNKNYSPHPSFVRPPTKKKLFYQVYPKIFADSLWMMECRKKFGFRKINRVLSKFYIHESATSSVPTFKSINWHYNYSFKDFLKEFVKLIIYFFIGKKKFHDFIYYKKFKEFKK
jgi:hypothetical protein